VNAGALDGMQAGIERGSLAWYWNRLRVMHPAEMVHRATGAFGRLAREPATRLPSPRLEAAPPSPWLAAAADAAAVPSCERARRLADQLLAGRWQRLDGAVVEIGHPPAWAGTHQPPAGVDIRHAMELHRHAHLVPLAQAFAASGDERYRQAVLDHLQSWFAACPYPHGAAWASALDAGLRLLNWSLVWQLIGVDAGGSHPLPAPLRRRWLDDVILHAHVIRHNLSRHSSANNHLIGELVGLVAAHATWPYWPRLGRWAATARSELERETLRQNAADGCNREQASWYQAFVFELLAVFVRIAQLQGAPVPSPVRARLAAMARFAAALRDAGGALSHHGDADHATALGLVLGHDDAIERMLGLAVAMRLAPELAPLLTEAPELGAWLVGPVDDAATPRDAGAAQAARQQLPREFADGGYFLLGRDFGGGDEVMMTVDAGPLGYLGIAAHGHADALSLRLSVGGRALLVDRGTGSYNTEPSWRRYFRGTLAHNTVCIDGSEQSGYGGPFLWLGKARCTVRRFGSDDMHGVIEASHDGYRRLRGRPLHERGVEWVAAERRFTVTDTIRGRGPREIAIAWHFAPECAVAIDRDGVVTASRDAVSLRLRVDGGDAAGRWSLHRGSADSFLGWHSPRLGVRVPAYSLVWHAAVDGTARVVTSLQVETTPNGGDEHAAGDPGMRGGQLHDGRDAGPRGDLRRERPSAPARGDQRGQDRQVGT
jgi:hypothetical protein